MLLLATAPADDGPAAVRVTTALVTERIELPHTPAPVRLVLDPLAARFELRVARGAAPLAARVASHAGTVCPKVVVIDGGVELRCRTRRFDAWLSTAGGKTFLDIHELRGLPWRDGPGGPPSFHYDPVKSGIGGACPGDTGAARGECALRDGNLLEAATQLRGAIESLNKQHAMLRLGDVALSTGDPTTAMGWYRRAGASGVYARLARARICELEGDCLGSTEAVKRVFNPAGLPEPLRADMQARAVRAEALEGRLPSAIRLLSEQIHATGAASVCREGGEAICRGVVVEAMRQGLVALNGGGAHADADADANGDGAAQATKDAEAVLDTYLSLPGWDQGPLAVELSQAAAELAARLGAPVFGGNLLSAVAPSVPPGQRSDHLVRAAELFLDGDDLARARLVIEYAETRIGKRRSPRWIAMQKTLAARMAAEETARPEPAPPKPLVDPAEVTRELAAAAAADSRAKLASGGARNPGTLEGFPDPPAKDSARHAERSPRDEARTKEKLK
jgi:hypothetical protein